MEKEEPDFKIESLEENGVRRIVLDGETIVIPERKLSEKEIKARDLSKEAVERFSKLAAEAKTTFDYLKAFKGIYRNGEPENLLWMFEFGDISIETLFEDLGDERTTKDISRQARALDMLKAKLDVMPEKEGFAKVGIKTKRIGDEVVGYYVLAIFPQGAEVMQDHIRKNVLDTVDDKRAVFYETSAACATHAAYENYSATEDGQNHGLLYLPVKSYLEAKQAIQSDGGVAEFMLARTIEGTKITQDPESFLLLALMGGLSGSGGMPGEDNRVIISDFWRKKGQKY